MEAFGSAGAVRTVRKGVVLEKPWDFKTDVFICDTARSFAVERRILQFLKPHPRIVRYIGVHEDGVSLLLGEASRGCLQDYIDSHHAEMPPSPIRKWQRQAAEAIAHLHSSGVIHSDVRLGNFLVDGPDGDLGLRLCDFGGSCCAGLGVDGKGLPSPPIWHPPVGVEPAPALDIFGLGTVLYSLAVGRLPFRPRERADREAYEADVEARFGRGGSPICRL